MTVLRQSNLSLNFNLNFNVFLFFGTNVLHVYGVRSFLNLDDFLLSSCVPPILLYDVVGELGEHVADTPCVCLFALASRPCRCPICASLAGRA